MKYHKLIITFLTLIIFTIFFRTISASSCTDCVDQCILNKGIFYDCTNDCYPPCTPYLHICGDGSCDSGLWGETITTCPEDCYVCGDSICTPPRETYTTCFMDCNSTYYGGCASNEIKHDGICIAYYNTFPPYTIMDKNMLINPVVFGSIKIIGGDYLKLNTTNATNRSIRKMDGSVLVNDLPIFDVGNDKNTFVLYLTPAANITENYLETYEFFFHLVFGTGQNENKDIELPFRLFK